ASDREDGYAGVVQAANLAGDEGAFGVARVGTVEQVSRVQEQVGTPCNGAIYHSLEGRLQGASPRFESVGSQTGVVGAQMVVARNDGGDHLRSSSAYHSELAGCGRHGGEHGPPEARERNHGLTGGKPGQSRP